jgi:hypothetical protein
VVIFSKHDEPTAFGRVAQRHPARGAWKLARG